MPSVARLAILPSVTRRTYDHLARLARAHLDDVHAARWVGLLRPAVQLRHARDGDDVVARLAGTPALPDDVPWPEWPGRGPLRFVAEVDLALLAHARLDAGLALPADGRLLAFYFDDSSTGSVVTTSDPDSFPGARLLHVRHTTPTTDPVVALAGVQVLTWPDYEHPVLAHHGLDELPDPFVEALGELLDDELAPSVWGSHLGGWARPAQGPVELEVAEIPLGKATYDDAHTAEALRWRPLLQIDSDHAAGPAWGEADCLYWLARTDGAAPPCESDIAFTWQC